MSQVQDPGVGVARPSLFQRITIPTGEPPAWAFVRYLVAGLAAGVALGAALPHFRATVLAALAGVVVSACASIGPSGIARRLAAVAAAWTLVLTTVGFATGGHPVWAALAMGAVAVLTSVSAAAGPLGGALGFLLSLAYLLVVGMSRTKNLFDAVSVGWAATHIAVGCVAGLLVAFAGTAWRRRGEPDESGRRGRRCRSRRSWPPCARSTNTPATASGARYRCRS